MVEFRGTPALHLVVCKDRAGAVESCENRLYSTRRTQVHVREVAWVPPLIRITQSQHPIFVRAPAFESVVVQHGTGDFAVSSI